MITSRSRFAASDLFDLVKEGSVVVTPNAPITRTAREYRQWFDKYGKGDWRVKMLNHPDSRHFSHIGARGEPGVSWQWREEQWQIAIQEANIIHGVTGEWPLWIMFSDPRVATKCKLEMS